MRERMSLDIEYTIDPCAHCRRGADVLEWNITYNLSAMWRAAGFPLSPDNDVSGRTGAELRGTFATALEALTRRKAEMVEKHTPPNGWGSYEGLLKAMTELVAAMEAHPSGTIAFRR